MRLWIQSLACSYLLGYFREHQPWFFSCSTAKHLLRKKSVLLVLYKGPLYRHTTERDRDKEKDEKKGQQPAEFEPLIS